MKFLILLVAIFLGIYSIHAATPARSFSLVPCISKGSIKDKDGKVVKGVCETNIGYTYDDAVTLCAQYGMDLFLAEDQFVYNSFLEYSKLNFKNCGTQWNAGCGMYINGKKNINDSKWYATINGQQQAMDVSFYNWVQNPAASVPGNCMSLKNQNGFGSTPWYCQQPFCPVCEYNNTYQPPASCIVSNQGKRYYNLAQCKSIGTIRDNCGNVVKGVCEINTPYSYDDAIQACRNVGMDLFVAETPAIALGFMQYIQGQFGHHTCGAVWNIGCGLWIGGKKSSSGGYTAVKDWRSVALDTSFYSFSTSTSPGDCIAIKNNNGFKVVDYACTQPYGPICEFDSKFT